jgi:hypothetical protein
MPTPETETQPTNATLSQALTLQSNAQETKVSIRFPETHHTNFKSFKSHSAEHGRPLLGHPKSSNDKELGV